MIKNKVLIVDDQHWVKLMLKEALATSGFEAYMASNFMEAMEIVKTQQPEIVIIDVNLPDVDGLELMPILKRIKPDIKAILISGSSNAAITQRAITEGALKYFVKPFDIFDLVAYLIEISSIDAVSKGEV